MKVEAIKQANGFLIPMNEIFREITKEKVLLDVKIVEPEQTEEYAALDRLIGICETGQTKASVNHDTILYSRKEPK
ncbi:hypothetical protein WDW89_26445 [Deltaproteobacteria bacterium TL4]